jgi:RimJ/RimL family protein N-acetyltransferase
MGKVRVVPMQLEHYVYADVMAGTPPEHAEVRGRSYLATPGRCYAAFDEQDHLLGVGGIFRDVPTHGYAWACLTPAAHARPLALTRAVRRMIPEIAGQLELGRVSAKAVEQDPRSGKWLRVLGFTKEFVMRRAGGFGADMGLYCVFFEEW